MEIIGEVEDINGNSLKGLVSPTVIVGSSTGPALINAYLFNQVGGPAGSSPRALQLVWNGGVTGPRGGDLGEAELNNDDDEYEVNSNIILPTVITDFNILNKYHSTIHLY